MSSELTYDEVQNLPVPIDEEPGSIAPAVVKTNGWKDQRDKLFRKLRYPKEVKEKILVRLSELSAQGTDKHTMLATMKAEGFTKADGKEIDISWLDYFRYNNRIAKYPTRGEVGEAHLKSKAQDVVDELRDELDKPQSYGESQYSSATHAILRDDQINDAKKVRLLKVLWCEV